MSIPHIIPFDVAPPSLDLLYIAKLLPAQPVHGPSTARPPDHPFNLALLLVYLFWTPPPPMLFLHTPARPQDHPLQSRSSISSLLPCYFCSSRPSTARPQPVHPHHPPSHIAPPSLASSHAISAPPARPQPVHRIPLRRRSSVHRIIPFNLAPPSLASSHAISAAPARPPPVHRIIPFDLAPPSLASSHAISAAPARAVPSAAQPVHSSSTVPSTGSSPSISLLHL